MPARQTAADIDRIAADWVVREDRRPLSAAEQAELDAWLGADARRQGAYVRAQAAWSMLERGRAMAAETPPPRRWPLATRRELMAAGLVGVAGIGGLLAASQIGWQSYGAARGEVRRVPLGDGSSAAINTASRIEVSMSDDQRTVKLARGEAWFDVASDRGRPFVVEAREVRVRASGGAFSIRRMAHGAEVIVAKGVLECWTAAEPDRVLRLPAGTKMLISNSAVSDPQVLAPAAVRRLLAWREGMVGLDGETLAEAAAEFNRYNERQIVIEDEALGRERLVGYFRANDPESFVRAAADTLGAQVAIGERELRLSPSAGV
jgi:transmembrane sensor